VRHHPFFMPAGSAPRILVSRTDRLGDLVLTLPAVLDLAAAFPSAHLAVLCRPENAALAALCPGVAQTIAWRAEDGTGGLTINGFDAAVVCYPKPPALAWRLYRAGIPLRVGTARRWWSFLFNEREAGGRTASGQHESELNRALARRCIARLGGPSAVCDRPARLELRLPESLKEKAATRIAQAGLPERGFAVLHAGSRGSAKDWPLERMLELAAALRGQGHAVAWTVGPADQAVRARLAAQPGNRLLENLPLDVLAAVLAQAGVVVANSTGPLHVAAAAGAPVVGLYPPVAACDPERWGPLGSQTRSLTAPTTGAEPARFANPRVAPADLMERIAVDSVLGTIAEVARW
jgi:ADP-heptose:LPS heptosyltransferase